MAEKTNPVSGMSASASSATPAIAKLAPVSVTVDHTRLLQTDGESIRVFLRNYDQYANTVLSRARQLTSATSTSEPVRPVDLKFCVDVDFLESSVVLGFITGVASPDELTDAQVPSFLEERAKESKDVVTLEMLDKIVRNELRTNMKNSNAKVRMQDLFSSYYTIFRRQGLSWIVKDNQKVAVMHVLSAIRPQSIKDRLESDLAFSQHPLRKDFPGFLAHAIKLAEAFQLVDSGPPSKRRRNDDDNRRSGNGDIPRKPGNPTKPGNPNPNKGKTPEVPVCLWEPHKKTGIRHLLKDCPDCPAEERHRILKERADEKAKTGPARSTRSQTDTRTTGRLASQTVNMCISPSCPVVVSDGIASMNATGRCDDGSDDNIASSSVAQRAVLQGIGRLEAITPIMIQVALKTSDKAEEFQFSRVWKVPRLVMELSSGRLALTNLSFLVSDAEMASDDVLIGLPVLQHLGIDSRTLLERNRAKLDGTDCYSVPQPSAASSKCGTLGHLMIARHQRVNGREPIYSDSNDQARLLPLDPGRPRENYFAHNFDEDPFPDPNLMDQDNKSKDEAEVREIEAMIQRAIDNDLEKRFVKPLRRLVFEFRSTFSTRFSSTPSKADPLEIQLTPDARPTKVKPRNYYPGQRIFMKKMMD